MDWIKKHVDTVIVLGGILSSFLWINSEMRGIDKRMTAIESRLTKIETILIVTGVMHPSLACKKVDENLQKGV